MLVVSGLEHYGQSNWEQLHTCLCVMCVSVPRSVCLYTLGKYLGVESLSPAEDV